MVGEEPRTVMSSAWRVLVILGLLSPVLGSLYAPRQWGPTRRTPPRGFEPGFEPRFEPGFRNTLPDYLVPCYQDDVLHQRDTRIPMTMANLIDMVRRVERHPGFTVDLRVLTTTLLHRFRVDGLERDPEVPAAPGVTPYRPVGVQFARHNVLMHQLLSGNPSLFPNDSLTMAEQCALHTMLSTAVDPWERGDESKACPNQPTPRGAFPVRPDLSARPGPTGNVYWPQQRSYPDPRLDVGHWGGTSFVSPPPQPPLSSPSWSACPVEEGAVEVGPWGGGLAVSAGAVLAGVAAGLQPQSVSLSNLLNPTHLARLRADGGQETATISNLWAATLAGDLAEVAIYQGPMREVGGMRLGPGGQWEDPVVPRVRYLSRMRPGSPEEAPVRHWEMTDAEVLGGFDGLAIGSFVRTWTRRLSRLRLSQILEMYYSPRGISFQPEVRACQRARAVSTVLTAENLLAQTATFGRTLASWSPDAPYMTEAALRNFSSSAIRAFHKYGSILLSGETCPPTPRTDIRANILVVLDATWDPETAFRFLSLLVAGADVSLFGSRIGVMSGEREGRWLVNFTDSPVRLATDWMEASRRDRWPTQLDLPWSLVAAQQHLVNAEEAASRAGAIGNVRGDLVLILAASSSVSDADMRHSLKLLPEIKQVAPDARFLYVVDETAHDRFQALVDLDPVAEDSVIALSEKPPSPETIASDVLNYLKQKVVGRLVAPECILVSASTPSWPLEKGVTLGPETPSGNLVRGELEDYVSPGQLRVYRIHPAYLRPGQQLDLVVVGQGYGDLWACMWRGATPQEDKESLLDPREPLEPHSGDLQQANCTAILDHAEGNLILMDPCADGCAPVFVSVATNRTSFKCAEEDCRFPDQVRFILRPRRGLFCASGENAEFWPQHSASTRVNFITACVVISALVGLTAHII